MSNIVDQDARVTITEIQKVMVAQLKEDKIEAAQATFKTLQQFSIGQADRLSYLIDVVMNKYRTTDPRRYKALERFPKSTLGQQQVRRVCEERSDEALRIPQNHDFNAINTSFFATRFVLRRSLLPLASPSKSRRSSRLLALRGGRRDSGRR